MSEEYPDPLSFLADSGQLVDRVNLGFESGVLEIFFYYPESREEISVGMFFEDDSAADLLCCQQLQLSLFYPPPHVQHVKAWFNLLLYMGLVWVMVRLYTCICSCTDWGLKSTPPVNTWRPIEFILFTSCHHSQLP
jgi:hypothetical protein